MSMKTPHNLDYFHYYFISQRSIVPFFLCFCYINNALLSTKISIADLYYCHRDIYSVHLFAGVPSYFPFGANRMEETVENFS